MTKSTRAALCLVMAAAIGLLACLGSQYFRDRKTLPVTETQLTESRATWEATAAAKEELQAELTQVNNDLREANLTIQESATRAEELRQDIAELEEDIAEMKNQSD